MRPPPGVNAARSTSPKTREHRENPAPFCHLQWLPATASGKTAEVKARVKHITADLHDEGENVLKYLGVKTQHSERRLGKAVILKEFFKKYLKAGFQGRGGLQAAWA